MASLSELGPLVASAAEAKDMQRRADLAERGWTFWEKRNLNIHRVVGLLRETQPIANAHALDAELRGALARNFKRAWWRGIAYGAVVASGGPVTFTPDDLKVLVDGRENSKGTMQWVVLVPPEGRTATGVHTWVEGFLSPVYRGVLQHLADRGYQVTSVRKEKDGLMRVLTAVADGRTRALIGKPAFTDFQDPFPGPGTDKTKGTGDTKVP